MTLIKFISDIHLEAKDNIHIDVVPENAKDITLVLAGDICEIDKLNKLLTFLKACCAAYKNVLYIFGNHEFYNGSIVRAPIKLHEAVNGPEFANLHIMNRKALVIDDVKFIGATLWTDLDRGNPLFAIQVTDKFNGLNDYNFIRAGTMEDPYMYRLWPRDVIGMHLKDLDFIKKELTYDTRKTVVITHHAPLISLLNLGPYAHHRLNPAYGSQLDSFVAESYVDLWIHGHTHWSSDNDFYGTRIVCNPKGYSNHDNPTFDYNKIIEL